MTFDPTKPVQTKSGKKARIICSKVKGDDSIIVLIERINGSEYPLKFTKEGLYLSIDDGIFECLINIPEPKPIDVHVGGVYKARNGDIGVCLKKEECGSHGTYFLAKKECLWTQDYGKFISFPDHDLDLIEHLADIKNIHEYIKEKMR